MNKNYLKLFSGFLALGVPTLQADWIKVFDFQDYEVTNDESALMDKGWIFIDNNFIGFPDCIQQTKDCTGVREVVVDPTNPENKAFLIRAVSPDVVNPANGASSTAFDLPQEIPVNGEATLYLRVYAVDENISNHFGLTAYDEPESYTGTDSSVASHTYGDLSSGGQVSPRTRDTFGLYHGFWSDATLDTEKTIELGTWYELWYHITHAPTSVGGGYYEVYVRGGNFGDEPFHLENPYLDQAIKDLGITSWDFRNLPDAPLKRFLNVANGLNPNTTPVNDGAMLIDDMYMMLDEFTTETPPLTTGGGTGCVAPSNFWAAVDVIAGTEFKETDIGLIHDEHFPWIYSADASAWLYVACDSTEESMYLYNANDENWYWTWEGSLGVHFKVGDPEYFEDGWAQW